MSLEKLSEERLALTEENFLSLWSKTYNTQGKPDWSHIFRYYHDEIIFQDSIQKVAFTEVNNHESLFEYLI